MGVCRLPIEVEVHLWLVHAVEVLTVRERDQPAVAKSLGLIRGQLRGRAAGREQQADAGCECQACDRGLNTGPRRSSMWQMNHVDAPCLVV
jgi:hypothetical protein